MQQKSLFHEFKTNATKFENKTAILFGNHPISYRRLLDAIERLASALSGMAASPGDRFAILLPNLPQFVISSFALNKVGLTIVPIDPATEPATFEHILRTCQIRGVIALDRLFEPFRSLDSLAGVTTKIILGDTVFPNAHNLTKLIANSEPLESECSYPNNWVSAIFQTAGTAGQPKLVALDDPTLLCQAEAARRAFALEPRHVIFCLAPFSNSCASLASMITPLISGSTVVLFPKVELTEVITALQPHEDALLMAPNLILEQCLQKRGEWPAVPKFEAAVCLGTPMSASRRFEFQEKFGAPVIQGYGLTEAGPFVSVYDPRINQKNESAGFPNFGFQIRIVDAKNRDLETGSVGEILIQSAAVAKGYLEADQSHQHFIDSWLRTSDLGKIDELGNLYVVGRKQDLILKGGFEIYPDEIKALLKQHPKVRDCTIVGVRDEILGQEIKALVVPTNGNHLTKEELAAFCHERLAAYKCPKVIEIVNSLIEKPAAGAPHMPSASEPVPALTDPNVVS
ncbi:MAG TPA: AMP-binding protein [bacterium]